MLPIDTALTTYELRLELTTLGDGPTHHISFFVTDQHGQWQLLDDWTPESAHDAVQAYGETVGMVETWLEFGGRSLPA